MNGIKVAIGCSILTCSIGCKHVCIPHRLQHIEMQYRLQHVHRNPGRLATGAQAPRGYAHKEGAHWTPSAAELLDVAGQDGCGRPG